MARADKLLRRGPLSVLAEQKEYEVQQNLVWSVERKRFWEHIELYHVLVIVERRNDAGDWIFEGEGKMAYYGGTLRYLLCDDFNHSRRRSLRRQIGMNVSRNALGTNSWRTTAASLSNTLLNTLRNVMIFDNRLD